HFILIPSNCSKIINIGKKLYQLRLVFGSAGNLSLRLDSKNILITSTGACLGSLNIKNIIKVDITKAKPDKPVSSEYPLHTLIYKNLPVRSIIHCHPPLTNAYFSIYKDLKNLTFESAFYLGKIAVIEHRALTITKPQKVIAALKDRNLVVVRNHGVVSVGKDFEEALRPIEILEESIKVVAVARLFDKKILDNLDKEIKKLIVQPHKPS
ncbi:MAG: class II aldolase/adducin family protein, partial [Candidatus Omnitrophica bacterium]|nr:class II aldolase/adducin family protein [Candidatus Omnitrophota bacterium]